MGDRHHLAQLQQQHQQHQHQHQLRMGNLPAGFRFHPTDDELVNAYLVPKVLDSTFTACAIGEADLNRCEPWDLPGMAKMGEKEWYFFTHKDRKYPSGSRTNRATEAGYWKATGKDKEVYNPGPAATRMLIGMKKTLVFYKGRAPRGEKTNWVMHEYRLGSGDDSDFDTNTKWVVCRVFHKSSGIKKTTPQSYAMPCGSQSITSPMAAAMAMAMSMPTMPMPMGEQVLNLNPTALMDATSLYGSGPSMGNAALPMNYFGNQQMAVPEQPPPPMFFQQDHQQMQIGADGFMAADPTSGPSSMVSQEHTSRLNDKQEQNSAAAADISSVEMGMDAMWKY